MSVHTLATSRPSALSRMTWWTTALVVLLVGLTAAAAWAAFHVVAVVNLSDSFTRTSLPGSVAISLDAGDRVVAYLEAPGAQVAPQADILVVGPDGTAVSTEAYPGVLLYDVDGAPGVLGHAARLIEATADGTYIVGSSSPASPPATTLAVGDDLSDALLRGVLPPALLAGGVLLLAAAMVVAPLAAGRPAGRVMPTAP
jgi:hypothetical protein